MVDVGAQYGAPQPLQLTMQTGQLSTMAPVPAVWNEALQPPFSTRPWSVFGEGPHVKAVTAGANAAAPFGAHDIRYTRNKAGTVVYAVALGWPNAALLLHALGTAASPAPGKVAHVELLGSPEATRWQQSAEGLRIDPPQQKPNSDSAVAFKISLG